MMLREADDAASRTHGIALWEDQSYVAAVSRRVERVLREEHPLDVVDVARHSGGAFPALVAHIVRKSHPSMPVQRASSGAALVNRLPHASPARGEWYFTRSSAMQVARLLEGRVLCLGVPSVAEQVGLTGQQTTLVDSSPWIQDRFEMGGVQHEMSTVEDWQPSQVFDSAVVDPPWYGSAITLWVERASSAVRYGGIIAVPLLGELTRPNAVGDREVILNAATQLGEAEVLPNIIEYEVPYYEQRALIAAGCPITASWRRADLLMIRCTSPAKSQVLQNHDAEEDEWVDFRVVEHLVSVKRSRLAHEFSRESRPLLSVVPGASQYLLDSVSRRDPRVQEADVWTSANTVARIGDLVVFMRCLDEISAATTQPTGAAAVSAANSATRLLLLTLQLE